MRIKPQTAIKLLFYCWIGQLALAGYQFWVEDYLFMSVSLLFAGWIFLRWRKAKTMIEPDKTWRSYR